MRKRGGAPFSPFHVIVAAALLYAVFLLVVSPRVPVSTTTTTRSTSPRTQLRPLSVESDVATANPTPPRPDDVIIILLPSTLPPPLVSSIDYNQPNSTVQIDRSATEAFHVGRQLLADLLVSAADTSSASPSPSPSNSPTTCPASISLTGDEFVESSNRLLELPCGLTLGSHIAVVAKPRGAHTEREPRINAEGGEVMVSQFMMELLGIEMVDGEDPPRIFHFNPRLKGDFTGRPVIEQNTCYRMQWGPPLRCEGSRSRHDEDTGKSFI